MPNAAVQWTVDEFWGQLQNLEDQINQANTALLDNRTQLQGMYTAMRLNMDPSRDAFLTPLIHQNTVLRLDYLKPVKDKFNEAVAAASGVLRGAGYTTPQLSGLGVLPAIPVIAVTAVLVALAAVLIVNRLTQAQIARTNTMASIYNDPNTSPTQKAALGETYKTQINAENKAAPPPLGFDVSAFIPILALVAIIVLGPQIMRMLPGRRATA